MNSEKLMDIFARGASILNYIRRINKSVNVFRIVVYAAMLIFVAVNIVDLTFVVKNKT